MLRYVMLYSSLFRKQVFDRLTAAVMAVVILFPLPNVVNRIGPCLDVVASSLVPTNLHRI